MAQAIYPLLFTLRPIMYIISSTLHSNFVCSTSTGPQPLGYGFQLTTGTRSQRPFINAQYPRSRPRGYLLQPGRWHQPPHQSPPHARLPLHQILPQRQPEPSLLRSSLSLRQRFVLFFPVTVLHTHNDKTIKSRPPLPPTHHTPPGAQGGIHGLVHHSPNSAQR